MPQIANLFVAIALFLVWIARWKDSGTQEYQALSKGAKHFIGGASTLLLILDNKRQE